MIARRTRRHSAPPGGARTTARDFYWRDAGPRGATMVPGRRSLPGRPSASSPTRRGGNAIMSLSPPAPAPPAMDLCRPEEPAGRALNTPVARWHVTGAAGSPGTAHHLATSLELFHTFALIHDEVMDRSATRRSRPTAHRVQAGRYHGQRPPGTPGNTPPDAPVTSGPPSPVPTSGCWMRCRRMRFRRGGIPAPQRPLRRLR
jgi:hypothetical protein